MSDATRPLLRPCRGCNTEKPCADFYLRRGKPSGNCRDCINAKRQAERDAQRKPRDPGGHPCGYCAAPVPADNCGRGPRRFCSKQCASRSWAHENYEANLRVPKESGGHPCARCGNPVPEKKVGGKARKFCSRDCAIAQNRADQPMRHRKYTLAKYGLTEDEYERMRAEQGDCCAICKTTDKRSPWGEWPIDHCHATGVVRGLLCGSCNRALGLLADDPEIMRAAAAYVERHLSHAIPTP